MSRTATCFKCTERANIKINILKYCNNCFIDLFNQKILKNIPKVSLDQTVFVYLPASSSSIVAIDFLEKFFSKRPVKNFKIFCSDLRVINYAKSLKVEISQFLDNKILDINNINKSEVLDDNAEVAQLQDFCESNDFNTLFYVKSLNESVTSSLYNICIGDSVTAIRAIKHNNNNIKSFNLLENIKSKELAYYFYLKKIKVFTKDSKPKDKEARIMDTIKKFLLEIDEKNELAIFNTSNTIKKLDEK